MVNLLLEPDTKVLTQEGGIVTICDPACGTGGTLADLRVTDVCHLRLPMGWRLCVNMSQEVSLNCVKK